MNALEKKKEKQGSSLILALNLHKADWFFFHQSSPAQVQPDRDGYLQQQPLEDSGIPPHESAMYRYRRVIYSFILSKAAPAGKGK